MSAPPGPGQPQLRPPFYPAGAPLPHLHLFKAYSELHAPAAAGRLTEVRSAGPDAAGGTCDPAARAAPDSSGPPAATEAAAAALGPSHHPTSEEQKPPSCDSTEPEPGSPPESGAGKSAPPAPATVLDPGIRRYRTAFRPDQIKRLEAEFLKDNYVSRPKRNELATELGLAEGTIKVWFQNRRMKHKRQQLTGWPLDPRLADPALAAMLLQAAVASSGGYPCWPGLAPPLPAYCGPLAAAKCRLAPYAPLPVRPQPTPPFLLPPLEPTLTAPLTTPLLPSVGRPGGHAHASQLDRSPQLDGVPQLDRPLHEGTMRDRTQAESTMVEGTQLQGSLPESTVADGIRLESSQVAGIELDSRLLGRSQLVKLDTGGSGSENCESQVQSNREEINTGLHRDVKSTAVTRTDVGEIQQATIGTVAVSRAANSSGLFRPF